MVYPQTMGMGDSNVQCNRVHHHTHICHTHDQNTMGIPIPMKYPSQILQGLLFVITGIGLRSLPLQVVFSFLF